METEVIKVGLNANLLEAEYSYSGNDLPFSIQWLRSESSSTPKALLLHIPRPKLH